MSDPEPTIDPRDPFTQVHEKLWELIESDETIASLVKTGNRINRMQGVVKQDKDRHSENDLPEIKIDPAGGRCEIKKTNTSMPITQNFAISLKTGDLRVDRTFFPLKWALLSKLTDTPNMLGLPFVRHITLSDISDERNIEHLDGWTAAFTVTVEMWFKIV